jgi:hypothetical protein
MENLLFLISKHILIFIILITFYFVLTDRIGTSGSIESLPWDYKILLTIAALSFLGLPFFYLGPSGIWITVVMFAYFIYDNGSSRS